MNRFLLAVIMVTVPTLFQLVGGNLSVRKKMRMPFALVCIVSVLVQLLAIFGGLQFVFADMQEQEIRCGMPAAAFFVCGLIMAVILLLVISGQLLWRHFRNG